MFLSSVEALGETPTTAPTPTATPVPVHRDWQAQAARRCLTGGRLRGTVTVKIQRARKGRDKTVSSRRGTVRENCRYTHKRTFGRKRLKRRRGTLKFVIRFQGNQVLKPRRIVRRAKFGRPSL